MRNISGISGAAPIWHDFMEEAFARTPAEDFERPPGILELEICPLSGLLPGPDCPHRRREYFIAGTEPTRECNLHRSLRIDVTTGLLATDECPPQSVVERTYTYYPPEALEWAREEGLALPPERYSQAHQSNNSIREAQPAQAGPIAPEGLAEATEIVLTQPDPNGVFRITSELPQVDQRIEIAARTNVGEPLREMTLLLNGAPVAVVNQAPYRTMWQLRPGEHKLQAEGLTQDGTQLRSDVVKITVLE